MREHSMHEHPTPATLYEKVWQSHLVRPATEFTPAVLYIDMHLVHEVTSPQAFAELRRRGLRVRRPDRTVATMDHVIPTVARRQDGKLAVVDSAVAHQLEQLTINCQEFGVPLYDTDSAQQGIVHVIGPELGLTHPGRTLVCGDSHTSTHGAFGTLAFGIGTTEVGHVLATQCLLQQRAKTMEIRIDGTLAPGVGAKDVILALIARLGVGGGTGFVFEYTGSAIRAMTMEQRMTVCNMSIEAGARAGMIAPDDTTYAYLDGRPFVPRGPAWDTAVAHWGMLRTDDGAQYDATFHLDASTLAPMITYGTNPGMAIPIDGAVPDPDQVIHADERRALSDALRYMGMSPGQQLRGTPVDVVFIGSCTNSRLNDLREVAAVLRDRRVAQNVQLLVVPGSQTVKRQAEAEGIDQVIRAAGGEWREPGCSMCIAMNGDALEPGQLAVSTSNRNFEGRQGTGGRTLLASPLTAAACAVTGVITDPRSLL